MAADDSVKNLVENLKADLDEVFSRYPEISVNGDLHLYEPSKAKKFNVRVVDATAATYIKAAIEQNRIP